MKRHATRTPVAANRAASVPTPKNGETPGAALVDAAVVADYLGVSRDYVYEHADDLGARRLGTGARPRLRFSLVEVADHVNCCSAGRRSEEAETRMVEPKPRRRVPTGSGSGVVLLPIRGRTA